jgi:hypothetical protein
MTTELVIRDDQARVKARIIETLAQAIVEDYLSETRPESDSDEPPSEIEAAQRWGTVRFPLGTPLTGLTQTSRK